MSLFCLYSVWFLRATCILIPYQIKPEISANSVLSTNFPLTEYIHSQLPWWTLENNQAFTSVFPKSKFSPDAESALSCLWNKALLCLLPSKPCSAFLLSPVWITSMLIYLTERKWLHLQKSKLWCISGDILKVAYDPHFILYWFWYCQTEHQSGRLFFRTIPLSILQSTEQNFLNCESQLAVM